MKLLPFRPPSLVGPRVQPPSTDGVPRRKRPPVAPKTAPSSTTPSSTAPSSTAGPPRDNTPVPILKHLAQQRQPVFESVDAWSVVPRRGTQVNNVVPFRRRRAVRRLRRHPLVRWLQPFVLAVAIVAVPVALAAWFWSSPRFALADVQITTGERVPDAWVRERMDPFLDRNLLLLPLERVQGRLRQHPWVASISLRKEPPGRLHIRIEERQEVALLRRGGELLYVDNRGNPITPFMPNGKEVDLVILSQRDEEAEAGIALEFLQELKDAEVAWLAGLSEIRALGQKDFKIFTTNLPFPLLLRGGTVEYKARRLETLLPQIVARYGSGVEVDLRFARRIIVQPGPRMVNTQEPGVPLRIGVS